MHFSNQSCSHKRERRLCGITPSPAFNCYNDSYEVHAALPTSVSPVMACNTLCYASLQFFVHLHCRLIGMALCCLVMVLIPAVLMMTSRGLPACKGQSKPWRKMLQMQCPSLHTTKACLSHCSRALSLIKMAFRQCKNQQGDELCKHIECLKHISAQWFCMSLCVSSCWSRAVGRLLQSCCPFCVCRSLVYAVCYWLGVFMEHRVDRVGASLTTGAPSGMTVKVMCDMTRSMCLSNQCRVLDMPQCCSS